MASDVTQKTLDESFDTLLKAIKPTEGEGNGGGSVKNGTKKAAKKRRDPEAYAAVFDRKAAEGSSQTEEEDEDADEATANPDFDPDEGEDGYEDEGGSSKVRKAVKADKAREEDEDDEDDEEEDEDEQEDEDETSGEDEDEAKETPVRRRDVKKSFGAEAEAWMDAEPLVKALLTQTVAQRKEIARLTEALAKQNEMLAKGFKALNKRVSAAEDLAEAVAGQPVRKSVSASKLDTAKRFREPAAPNPKQIADILEKGFGEGKIKGREISRYENSRGNWGALSPEAQAYVQANLKG